MGSKPLFTLALATLLVLPACVESEQPLSDPNTAKQDVRLYGAWSVTQPGGDVQYVHIGADSPQKAGSSKSLMRLWLLTHHATENTLSKSSGMPFFKTEIDGNSYANLIAPSEEAEQGPTRYWFCKYRVRGDELDIWAMDWKVIARAIERGQLKGKVGDLKQALMTDTTENIVRFLRDGGHRTLFPDTGKTVYKRVR